MTHFANRMRDRDVPADALPRAGHKRATPAVQLNVAADAPERLARNDAPGQLLALQRAAGNQAVSGLVGQLVVQRHEGPTTDEEAEAAAGQAQPGEVGAVPTESAAGEEAIAGAAPEAGAADTAEQDTTGQESASPAGAETTSQPGVGTGTTGSVGKGLKGDVRKKAIEDVLRASNTGTWALSIVDKWKIPIDWEYGGEGSFQRGGKIFINKTLGVGAAALTLMHEAQHANTYKTGTSADRSKLDRAAYVKLSIADEAEAVVRQVEGLAVTEGLGADMSGSPIDDALKQRYLTAFYKKRDELNKANPAMSTAEVNAICRTSTRDGEVTKWFYDGTFVTSTDHNPYADFYGKQWDDVHKKPGK